MDRTIARSWIALVVVMALAIGVTARVVLAADMAAGMMAMATDIPGDCGDCGDGDAGTATSLCHLVCGNPATIGDASTPALPGSTNLRPGEATDVGAGRSIRPDPSPPRPAALS